MQVNGKQLELDIFELDTAKRFESAVRQVAERMNRLKKQEMSLTDSIRAQCEAVAECFDSIWGEGTAARIFDGHVNLKLALKAFEELIAGVSAQKEEMMGLAHSIAENQSSRRTDAQ